MDSIRQDLRHALRSIARSPRFAAVIIATLAIGIGVTTAVFSIVNGVLLNPLGFAAPDRLVYIQSISTTGHPMPVSPQDLIDYRRGAPSLADVAAIDAGGNRTLTHGTAAAMRVSAARVSANFFSLLGVHAAIGRFFAPGEDSASAPKTVVLSDASWKRDFGGDSAAIGGRVSLDGAEYQIIGVAPPHFTFPDAPDVWTPAVWESWEVGDTHRGLHSIAGVGRLAPGATAASATRDLASVAARIAREFPRYDAKIGAAATPLRTRIVGDVEGPLWTMFGAVALVLLIACANIGNLLLVRASARESEFAVRVALGASRARLLQQSVIESVILALLGALAGMLLSAWLVEMLVVFGPATITRLHEMTIDGRVVAFTVVLTMVIGVAFGMIPALHVRQASLTKSLRAGARGLTSRNRLRAGIVLAEIAFGTILTIGAGLLIRSFERLMSVDPGFRPAQLIVFDAALSGKRYEFDAGQIQFTDDVLRRLAALPGTRGVAVAGDRPIDTSPGFEASTSFTIDGEPKPAPGMAPESAILPVSPGFFSAMGIQLSRGRLFSDAENRVNDAPVVVVNEALVRRYFPGQNPLGKRITFGLAHSTTANEADSVRARGEIIGVVHDVAQTGLSAPAEPATYLPYHTLPLGQGFVVRTDADPSVVEKEIRDVMRDVDPNVPVFEMQTMADALSASVAQPRFYTFLLTGFAIIALFLALLGVYGVVAFVVTQRSREFGIRLALGATSSNVTRLVVSRTTGLGVLGVAVGLAGAVALTRALQSLLFHVTAGDPSTYAGAAVFMLGAVVLAAWIPARRAGRVDPATTIRAE